MPRQSKCRVCRKNRLDTPHQTQCADCAEYGDYFNSISTRAEREITRQMEPAALIDKLNRGDDDVLLLLHASELQRSSIARWLGRPHDDLSPRVVSVNPDPVGVEFVLEAAGGERSKLWRPYRMEIRLMVAGVPVLLVEPTDNSQGEDSTT